MVTLALTEPQARAVQAALEDEATACRQPPSRAAAHVGGMHNARLDDLRDVWRALAAQRGGRR